ncbi:uncharacterized protein MYCFIDRAFT_83546 [Pseudocercospora fijiensis CIRAD86]|uniref:Zn(2)-C6 fungal-type domain-containing protein n=1 Tax=Pseudocercospora fijiensis (strain CIRAD86) TaxID=383855 RepID=M2ZT65_PSEFD|nr:uncharacterized protein MYCFIDRAFT_83546 [Pseudocercospora fijiensis CIRAD86]EME82204.1 hypothetical protein MYCFIDRAFT_83546 [Pseudocercospora fijiensis CIRAD86]
MSTSKRQRITQGSCWCCKKRRVKCDLVRPTCGRCESTAQVCGYGAAPFKWVGGMALRGKNAPANAPEIYNFSPLITAAAATDTDSSGHGRASDVGPSSPAPPANANATGNNGNGNGNGNGHGHGTHDRRPSDATTVHDDIDLLSPAPTLSIVPSTPPLDESCLMPYFANAVLPRFLLGDGILAVDYAMIAKDESLQQAVLAISRAHYNYQAKCGANDSALVRNSSRQVAITSFRKRLQVGTSGDDSAKELFANNVLLCMLDGMIQPSTELNASSMHLKGGFAMLNRWSCTITNMLLEGGLQSHLLSVFVTMDLGSSLLTGRKPYFEPILFHMFANTQAWWGYLPTGDRFLTLLRTLNEMAALGAVVFAHLPSGDGAFLAEKCFPPLTAVLEAPLPVHSLDGIDYRNWVTFCALWEACSSIYFYRALEQRTVDDELVQAHARKGVSTLIDALLPGMLQHCLVLPMLVIGAHCIHSQDRKAIVDALSPTVSYLAFGNLPLMVDFLKGSWEKSDFHSTWWETFHDISDRVFLF